ncbi:MAG: hypothetical protein A3K09_02675 [Nitrospinae bacterium RIFCSPLOWO2_12_FULL_47_7]|nr:MAG: hypothetical protein A3K09_02675 [Nitrospinae bacterium RIFCSPLOWO2_12_FULL_47_7]
MKKFAYVGMFIFGVLCFSSSAFATDLKPGDHSSCNNASAITLSATAPADASIWKSSNFTTIPITFGVNDEHSLPGGRGVDMADKSSKGRNAVKLTKQENFSRGDSIGDISGEVKITNTGNAVISVKCE